MTDLPERYRNLPARNVAVGESLIEEGVRNDNMFVLESGRFEVIKDGVPLARIEDAGMLMGEISVVLGSAPTATGVAIEPSSVRVIENATAATLSQPDLVFAVAQTLARRLASLTAYVADVRRQYKETDTHLGVLDRVVSQLISGGPADDVVVDSERKNEPRNEPENR
jgi:CRP/FNR family cyclic AMP-dependent transcriptional regulator